MGTLYIVSTPIGNLEDITLRALRILKSADMIAAESTRHSRGLCQYYGIKTRLTAYNQHNQKTRGPELIKKLKSGLDIALVTNAGTPCVSDPGVLLISQALDKGIKVSPIPGPSAVTAALSASGMRGDKFLFLGFMPNRSTKRRKELKDLISEPRTMVFFETPHRVQAMLKDIEETLGDRQIVIIRELTKVHEEVIRSSTSSILHQLKQDKIKGEFTLMVAGKGKDEDIHAMDEKTKKKIVKLLKENKMSIKDIAARLSGDEGLPYRNIYKECISIKRAMRPS